MGYFVELDLLQLFRSLCDLLPFDAAPHKAFRPGWNHVTFTQVVLNSFLSIEIIWDFQLLEVWPAMIVILENGRAREIGYSKLVRILLVVGLELRLQPLALERPTLDDLMKEDTDD